MVLLLLEAEEATLSSCLLISIKVHAHSSPNNCGAGEPSPEARPAGGSGWC